MTDIVKVAILGVSSNIEIGVVAEDIYLSRVPNIGETIKWKNTSCTVCLVNHIPYDSSNPEKLAAIVSVKFDK